MKDQNKCTMNDQNKCSKVIYSATGDKTQDEKLLLPFNYILRVPGKQIKAKLAHAFNIWLRVPDDKMHVIDDIGQILDNSSIIIDDIDGNSNLRRGIPVAHSIYSLASTINCNNYISFIALERVLSLEDSNATKIFTEQICELHRAKGKEMYWKDNLICPSEEEYKQMTLQKSGGIFLLIIKLMQCFSDNKSDFTKLAEILVLYNQIREDYFDLCKDEYSENKSYCDALTEGKFSFPIIHAIHEKPNDRLVMDILRQRPTDVDIKKYFISLLENYGSFKYTRDVLNILDEQARQEVKMIGSNPYMEKILDDLLTWKIV